MACRHGADAVYLGVEGFNMRARARNFDWDEYAEALDIAGERGVKIYVTANVLVSASELPSFRRHLERLMERPPHAVILGDAGALRLLRRIRPEQRVHLSTQASVSNPEAAAFWKEAGVARINLAREVPGRELPLFRERCPDLEVEVFVHGSMCIAFSGHCLLSSALARRSANRGGCAQPCRWDWALVEAKRPDEFLPVEEGAYTTLLSSRDLCLAREIPAMAAAGVDALKIEGRMKGPAYVAAVTRTYREILDRLAEEGEAFRHRESWDRALAETTHRPFGRGFWDGRPEDGTTAEKGYRSGSRFLGRVEARSADDVRSGLVVARAELEVGQELVLRHPEEGDLRRRIVAIRSHGGRPRERARSGDLVWLELDGAVEEDLVLVAPAEDDQ